MEEWKTYRLGDLCNVKGGKRLPKGVTLITERNSHPYIRIRDLSGKKIIELDNSYEYVDDVTQQTISRYIVTKGNILLSIVGTIGLCSIVGESLDSANLTENCVKLIKLNNIDRDYLYYYLISTEGQNEIKRGTVGAVQPKLPIKNIENIIVPLPPLPLQRRISSLLSSLDAKIETNRRINARLEEMAQALFRSWFIDFTPFKQQEFVEDECGRRPKGWEVVSLLDVAALFDSQRIPLSGMEREAMKERKYPYIGATCVMDYVDDYLFDGTYLLMGEDGSVAKENGLPYLQYVWGKFWLNNHAHIMQGKNGYSTEMLHCLLSQTTISEYVTGAVQAKLSQQNMRKIKVIKATDSIMKSFAEKIKPLYEKIKVCEQESSRLAALRDTLLPKLMSGELIPEEITA